MHKQYSLSGSLLLGLLLAAGTAIVWGVIVFGLSLAILLGLVATPESVFDEHLWFDEEEGTPLIGWRSRSDRRLRFRTLDGEQTEARGQWQTTRLHGPEGLKHLDVPVEWSRRILSASDHEIAPEYWYLIHDGRPDGHAWLEGFDGVTRQRIGYIDHHGLRDAPPTPDDGFPINWTAFQASCLSAFWGRFGYQPSLMDWRADSERIPPWIGYLVTSGKLVEIDVREHSVRTLLEDPRIVSASVVSHLSTDATVSESVIRRFVAVRSADRLWIVDPRTNQSYDLRIPDSWVDLPYLGILLVDDQIVLTNESWPQTDPVMLVWLSQDGRVLQERSVSLRTDVFPKLGVWAQVVAVPVPIAVVLNILVGDPLNELYGTVRAAHVQALTASWHRWRGPFAAICLLSIALAVWCFWRHRRYAQRGAWAWCVFVLLLGPGGLVGYLLHRRWPIRETCTACGRRAVVDRETCQHCGAPFPTPTLRGIEVFA